MHAVNDISADLTHFNQVGGRGDMPKVHGDLNKKGDRKHLDFTITCEVLRGSHPTPASSPSGEAAMCFFLTPNTLVVLHRQQVGECEPPSFTVPTEHT